MITYTFNQDDVTTPIISEILLGDDIPPELTSTGIVAFHGFITNDGHWGLDAIDSGKEEYGKKPDGYIAFPVQYRPASLATYGFLKKHFEQANDVEIISWALDPRVPDITEQEFDTVGNLRRRRNLPFGVTFKGNAQKIFEICSIINNQLTPSTLEKSSEAENDYNQQLQLLSLDQAGAPYPYEQNWSIGSNSL